jgi:hypothetical protein
MKSIATVILLITITTSSSANIIMNNKMNSFISRTAFDITLNNTQIPATETRATKGSKRVGGYNSKGKGSHYVRSR